MRHLMKHLKINVVGRVQGVGYRLSCLKAANKNNIKGIVKNNADGSVYIEAEGNPDDLDEFILWCQRGPAWSKVLDIKLAYGKLKNFKTFEILR